MKKILFFCICLLLLLFFYLEKPKQNKFFLNPSFNKFSIIRGGTTIKIEKGKIISPVLAELETNYLKDLNKLLEELTADAAVEEEQKQDAYGLDPPELVFVLEGAEGKEVLSFDKYADFATARYLQREGDSKIYLIKEDLFSFLNVDLNKIRTKNPIEFNPDYMQSIAVVSENFSSYVIKKTSGKWFLESPGTSFEVDSQIFNHAVQKLSKLEALDFVEGANLEFFGLTRPILILRVLINNKEGSKVLELIFGKGAGENSFYYMKELGKQSIFKIHRGAISWWLKEIDFFRPKKIFTAVSSLNNKKLTIEQIETLSEIKAPGVMSKATFLPTERPLVLDFNELKLEIGQKVPGEQGDESPSFVKINSAKQEYVLILAAKDIEFLYTLNVQ